MRQYEPYYIDPNDPDDWHKLIRDAAYLFLYTIIGIALCAMLHSCSTKQTMTERTDSIYIRLTDTVKVTETSKVKEVEYIDRYRAYTYVINPLTGDTTKQIQKEYCNVYYSQEQHDSINHYRALCDSLVREQKKNNIKTIEKKLTWWQQFEIDTYPLLLVSLLSTIAVIVINIFYHNKRP